jgi:LysM repeat protein
MKMKTPKFLIKLSAVLAPRPKKRLQANARAMRPEAMEEIDAEEPARLSSAFIVVLILHVVAVGGIYAFNSIKASRRDREQKAEAVSAPAPRKEQPAPEKAKPTAKAEVKPVPQVAAQTPAAARIAEVPTAPVPAVAQPVKPGALKQYVVKAGDNPSKIAREFSVTAAELIAANNLKDSVMLHAGQKLVIPQAKPGSKAATEETHKADAPDKQTDVPPTATTAGRYVVKKGDTPTSIAKKFGITSEDLLKINKGTDATKLQLGQVLKIPQKKG